MVLSAPAHAPQSRIQGRILRMVDADSVPAAGQWAVLHRVTMAGGGPVDSITTDPRGRYAMAVARPDTAATYLVSTRYHGIAYFSEPFTLREGSDTVATLFVFDTSSVAPAIAATERHVVIRPPEANGAHRVIELLVLVNGGTKTRVAPDTAHPIWEGPLAEGIVDFEVGAADMSAEAVYRRGNRVAVAAPIPPGERQVVIGYVIPPGSRTVVLPVGRDVSVLNLLVGDSAAVVPPTGLALTGQEMLEGVAYRRYTAALVGSGVSIAVEFPVPSRFEGLGLAVLVSVVAAALVLGLGIYVVRGRRAPVTPEGPHALAAEIAALDRAFAGKETDAYRQLRAELKARLTDALAPPDGDR